MANEQNLIPFDKRSENEAREIGKNGGIQSGKSRQKKRELKKVAQIMLDLPPTGKAKELIEGIGLEPDEYTNTMAIMVAMLNKALDGDERAARFLMEVSGNDPKQQNDAARLKMEKERHKKAMESTVITENTEEDVLIYLPAVTSKDDMIVKNYARE